MRSAVAAISLGVTLLLAAPLGAQEDPGSEPLIVSRVDVSQAPSLSAVLTPPSSLVGTGLTRQNITVTEDGQTRPVTVARLPSDGLEVVLLIDTSGSMRGAMSTARTAAADFVDSLPLGATTAVLGFGTEVTTVTDFTEDRAAVREAIGTLDARGETALYDALERALTQFAPEGQTRRAIVLLSDGGDTASAADLAAVEARLSGAGTPLFAIELVTPESDGAVLRNLAEASSGRVASADRPDDLAAVYGQIRSLLVNQYAVRFNAAGSGPTTFRFVIEFEEATAVAEQRIDLPAAVTQTPTFAPAPKPAPAGVPDVSTQAPPPMQDSRAGLLVGGALWFTALAILGLAALLPGERVAQLRGVGRGRASGRAGLTELADQASQLAERALRRRGKDGGLNAALERAGINLRPGEFAVLVGCGALAGLILGSVLGGPLLGIALALATVAGSRAVVKSKGDKRQAAFAEQLGETLQLLASSLRAGYSLMQAIDAVAREAEAPASDEFHRLVVESRLGRDVVDALHAMDNRLGSEDFNWVLQAIEINREVGGDLAEVLDTVAGTIRDRDQIRRQVRTLSAEGRMSAYVLMALPFAVGLFMLLVNPSYMREFTSNGPAGYGMLATGGMMLVVGGIWLRSMVKIPF